MRADDISAPKEQDWLIEGLWKGVGFIGGQPKAGKTFLACAMAAAVQEGDFVLGRRAKKVNVLYLAGEDSVEELAARLRRAGGGNVDVRASNTIGNLHQAVLEDDFGFVILDPMVRFTSSESLGPIRTFLGRLREVNRSTGAAIAVVHHVRKGKGSGGQMLRGSSELHAWGDSNFYLENRPSLGPCLFPENRNAPELFGRQVQVVDGRMRLVKPGDAWRLR